MSNSYTIAETRTYQKKISRSNYQRYYLRARERLYPQLKENPFTGPNIRKPKGDLGEIFRYRVGDFRLFYTIDAEKKIVYMLDLDNRKDAYRE